jgi:hypothetical protein
VTFHLDQCLQRLASRNPGRTEADIQADVRDVLLYGGFSLGDENVRLESPAPDQNRIDVEVGALVIECKRDLRPDRVLSDAEIQLFRYLNARETGSGSVFVGILTDGVFWRCYRTKDDLVEVVSVLELRQGAVDERRFRWWLGSVLATERQIVPAASSILERLGSESPGCQLALKELSDLWASAVSLREVQLKRSLWAKLLRTALGTQFEDEDSLFIEHTYLVLTATLIAHVIIGFGPSELQSSPGTVLSGQLFARSGIRGVGEAGFFDWVLDVDGGDRIVADMARRLSVFSWSGVDHDVLKALYQSVIAPETRHRLGEYYTPDWLARRMVDEVVTNPLINRVLDPACGSGTFLFHAIRKYFEASEVEGLSVESAVEGVVEHVFGMDLHPVAVVLAQVTYLLAIGTKRITQASVPLSIPVYLGDSMRWEIAEETFLASSGEIVVPTGSGQTLFASEELRFPASVVSDPARFDRLVDELASRAANRQRGERPLPIAGVLLNFAVPESDRPILEATYQHLCNLHDQERNHIWGFFVRNQSRPTWFASPDNRVDSLIGNPPWLSYRYMPEEMKLRFREFATERHLWSGGRVATQQDLSAFFVARSIELYLRIGGHFGFVMPLAALSRKAYEGFRKGDYSSVSTQCVVAFDTPWDLEAVDPDPFPVPSSVVLGQRIAPILHTDQSPLPTERVIVAGHLDANAGTGAGEGLTWKLLEPDEGATKYTEANSPYSKRFRQGATLVPRFMILVEEESPGPLQPKTYRSVRSRRGRLDKRPWNTLPDLTGVVEEIFLRNVYLGEHCLPFRTLDPFKAVIPYDGKEIMSGSDDRIDRFPGLAAWWRTAEQVWIANRSSDRLTLNERINYHAELTSQFPTPDIRIVYTKAGNFLTSAIITDREAVIDHKLYWGAAATLEEGLYLTAILNAPAIGEIVAPYQSRGAFGARDFDKYVWYPPIPEYDKTNGRHLRLAELGNEASKIVADVVIPNQVGFQRSRGLLREILHGSGVFDAIDNEIRLILADSDESH